MNREHTKAQLAKFQAAIDEWTLTPAKGVDPRMHQAYLDGLMSIRDELAKQLKDDEQ